MNKGSIYKRKDGRWEARVIMGKDANNKRKFRSFYGKTREEAEFKMMAESQLYVENYNITAATTDITVRQLSDEWLASISSRIKESTAANYRMKIQKHIIPAFGDVKCCMLRTKDIETFVEQKLKAGLSIRYIGDIIVLLKSFFRYASREYHIKNELEYFRIPKHFKPEVAVLSNKEQTKLKKYLTEHPSLTALGVSISLYTGIRIGELCALQWSDINFEKRTLTVRKTIQRIQCFSGKSKTKLIITEPKSHSSIREIPIPECLFSELKHYQNKKNFFLMSGSEKPLEPRTMQYRFARILKNVKLPSVHYHSLRHAFATGCVELGFDVKTLSEILGHSAVETTLNRYVHSSLDRKRKYMELLK